MRVLLTSGYFNQRGEVLRLWDFLRPHFPHAATRQLPSAEAAYEAAFPSRPFDMAKYRHLQSDLCKLIETFWQLQELQQRPAWQNQLLLSALTRRGLDQDFAATMVAAQTDLLSDPLRGAGFLRQRFDLALAQHDHEVRRSNRSTQVGLQAALEALDEEYFAHKLRLASAAINRNLVLGEATAIALLTEVLAFIDAAPAIVYMDGLVEVYRLVLRTLDPSPDHIAWEQLMRLLETSQERYPAETLAELYAFALNYCVRMVNLAEPHYDAQLFALYQLLLQRGYLLEDGLLPVQHYKNYVTLGLRLGHATQIATDLQALSLQLPPEIAANAVLYSQAALAFHQGNNRRAVRLLQQVAFTDVYYHLDAKSLLLKAWYLEEETEPLLSLLESFKIYLRRSRKISEYQRLTYRNQIKILHMLLRHRLGSRKPLAEIESTLQTSRPIADLAWLERQLAALR